MDGWREDEKDWFGREGRKEGLGKRVKVPAGTLFKTLRRKMLRSDDKAPRGCDEENEEKETTFLRRRMRSLVITIYVILYPRPLPHASSSSFSVLIVRLVLPSARGLTPREGLSEGRARRLVVSGLLHSGAEEEPGPLLALGMLLAQRTLHVQALLDHLPLRPLQ
eukprot:762768-Hanusia_phi.AAC.5